MVALLTNMLSASANDETLLGSGQGARAAVVRSLPAILRGAAGAPRSFRMIYLSQRLCKKITCSLSARVSTVFHERQMRESCLFSCGIYVRRVGRPHWVEKRELVCISAWCYSVGRVSFYSYNTNKIAGIEIKSTRSDLQKVSIALPYLF